MIISSSKSEGEPFTLILTGILFGILISSPSFGAEYPPNVVLILADDQGWNGLSTRMDSEEPGSQSDFYQTPNLNRLVAEGTRFSQGYAPAPVCSPTRHSIQFGISPAKTRVTHNDPSNKQHCDPKLALANLIKSANSDYQTAHFGKWHVSEKPEDCGFDHSDGSTGNREGDTSKDPDDPKRVYEVSKRAIDFIDKSAAANHPFFLQVSHYADHLKFKASQAMVDKYRKLPVGKRHTDPVFAAMNADLDAGVGMVLDTLDRLNLTSNTYVIYTADNGYDQSLDKLHGLHERKAWPLSYSKGFVREGGIRVPFIIRGPAIAAGVQCDVPVVGYDLMPTILDWIDPSFQLPERIEGGSLKAVLTGQATQVQRANEFMIFHYPSGVWPAESAIRLDDMKLVKSWALNRIALFNLKTDPSELSDLSKNQPEVTKKMDQQLTDYLDQVDAIFPTESKLNIDRKGVFMKKSSSGKKKKK